MGVIFNPRVHLAIENTSEDALQLVRLKDGDTNTVIYVNQGLICGGRDGEIRLLDWDCIKYGELSVGIVAPSAKSTATPSSGFLDCLQRIVHSRVRCLGKGVLQQLKTTRRGIEFLSVCPTFQKLAVLRESGIIQIIDVVRGKPALEDSKIPSLQALTTSYRVKTSIAPFTGIATIQLAEGPFFAVT